MTHGQWHIQLPSALQQHAKLQHGDVQLAFSSREEVFSQRQEIQSVYAAYIAEGMQQYAGVERDGTSGPRRIAACIMEPVLQVVYACKLSYWQPTRHRLYTLFLTNYCTCVDHFHRPSAASSYYA